jgi:glycosyltransferase involved in cell wall biosynthesis
LIAVERSRGPLGGRYDVVFFARWLGPLLTASDSRATGGAETQMLLLAKGLAASGHRVAVMVDEGRDALPSAVDGVDVIALSANGRRAVLRRVSWLASFGRAMWRVDAETLVQRAAGVETLLVGLAAKLRGRRFAYSSANVIDFDFGRLEPSRLNAALYHLGVRLADVIVVQTDEQATLCRQRFGRSAHVIRSIVEPHAPRRQRPEAFLWIGRLASYKQPLAYVDLARALPDARFRMVAVPQAPGADDPLTAAVRRAAAELPNLELLAPRPRAELAPLIEEAVAVVNTADYEGMPNVFLEGWTRGVPALALTHDPDGVIERERIGAFAGGDLSRFTQLARDLWQARDNGAATAARCVAYAAREHAAGAVVDQWRRALGLTEHRPGAADLRAA